MISGNIEPMPPNNIISIINNDKNNNKYKLSSHCINIEEINNILELKSFFCFYKWEEFINYF